MAFLVTVFSILLAMSALIYAQLELIISRNTLQRIYEAPTEDAATQITASAKETFDKEKPQQSGPQTELPQQDEAQENQAQKKRRRQYAKLNVGAIFNKDKEKSSDGFQTAYSLLHHLIYILFQDQSFFQNALEKRPHCIDELLDAIIAVANDPNTHIKKTHVRFIANLDLNDSFLQELLYKVLRNPAENKNLKNRRSTKKLGISLLDYIDTKNRKNSKLASCYLAKRPVLLALFGDVKIVDQLIQQRRTIAKELRKAEKKDRANLMKTYSQDFQNSFQTKVREGIDPSFIDFEVTGSIPSS